VILFFVTACAFLTRWPTLAALQRARATTIEQFFRSHHSHGALLERRLSEIKTASPLVTDTAVLTAQSLLVQSLLPQLQATLQAIAAHEQEIERLCASHPDFYLFDVLPGAGQVLTPRLLAALGTQRNRFASAQALRLFQWRRSSDRTQWPILLDTLALLLSEIPTPDLCRICRGVGEVLWLGQSLLPFAAQQRQRPRRSLARFGLQVDSPSLEMLADAHAL
jgi:hypothetical protein